MSTHDWERWKWEALAGSVRPMPDPYHPKAKVLRRAAAQIRADWPLCGDECSDSYALSTSFHRAVADLLEAEADAGEVDGLWKSALSVARAYLGESA